MTKKIMIPFMGLAIVEYSDVLASGTVDGKKYTCQFDTEGKYVDVYAN